MFYKFYNTYYNRTTVILKYSVSLNNSPCYFHDYFIAGAYYMYKQSELALKMMNSNIAVKSVI